MERIHVTVRPKPLSPEDANSSPWRISANSIAFFNHSSKFEFDRIFEQNCSTAEVYEDRTRDIVSAAVRGFNGTVFAYGQTNSGKTHTMRGSTTEPGVIPLAVRDLFDVIQQEVDREFLLRMSYMEIYNEDINDLLAPEHRKLQIHENLERGIYVAGLREEIVASPQQVLNFTEFGESHRHIGETNMNLYSSRSHTIFRMIIESRDRTEDDIVGNSCDAVRVSVLNLVDLAGSERASKTGAEGIRLKEGSHINKSLMTLGTVIKKLSEGVESQGGHVPYRDSKLTRILQPALGGNANTAIICNITLAQIHADETKSSLQFASRAKCVTNCARVNEILTDAALLKRQKKEIEDLRAKLQGSHSEHLEEEVLNLRNTLLQSELERERIALELEEEKKAQAEREKVLQEQAKKIKNLSSMVLYSSRDENRDHFKKGKRRDTWCPGNLLRDTQQVCSDFKPKDSAVKSMRPERVFEPLLPFEDLVTVNEEDECYQEKDCETNASEDCNFPDPCALLHITSRRKAPLRKQSPAVEDKELAEFQAEYEELLLKFEFQKTVSEINIDCLRRKLAEADSHYDLSCDDAFIPLVSNTISKGDRTVSARESEAIIVIKQLQEKVKMLEMEKSSSQQNLDSLVQLATEQNTCAREKLEELHEEIYNAREEARVAREHLAASGPAGSIDLSMETHDIMCIFQTVKEEMDSVSSLMDEVFQCFSATCQDFSEFKILMLQISDQQNFVSRNHEKLHSNLRQRVSELESENLSLRNHCANLQHQMQVTSAQKILETMEFHSQIKNLEEELSCLSSSFMVEEKESLIKELDKTKLNLQEIAFKLQIDIQQKTKLEGVKAFAEPMANHIQDQNILLEPVVRKHDSIVSRRRDSMVDQFDSEKGKNLGVSYEQLQEDYKKLEVCTFEMEATIASLEAKLAAAQREKEEAISRNENLASELEIISRKLNVSNSSLKELQENIYGLRLELEESNSKQQKLESSEQLLLNEKEDLAMQLKNSLLKMDEEKALWTSNEKAYAEEIEERAKRMLELKMELQSCKEECEVLRERLAQCEKSAEEEMECREREREDLVARINNNEVEQKKNSREMAKLTMRLRGTQAQLDAVRVRHRESVDEAQVMNRKYEEASTNLKRQLASTGLEVLNLKKQLAAALGKT